MKELDIQENTVRLIPVDRLKSIADGVFAVAMTLLVLDLTIPVTGDVSNTELTRALLSMWPKLVVYLLSFLIVGIYWLIHHIIFDNIRFYDSTLAWLNIVFLLFVALIPFTTSFLGKYFMAKTPTIIYGIQLLLMFFLGYSIFSYSAHRKELLAQELEPVIIKGTKRMGYLYFSIIASSIIITCFMPLISIIIYCLIVIIFILFTGIGKGEHVVVLSRKKASRQNQSNDLGKSTSK